jgi:hypothetical protein
MMNLRRSMGRARLWRSSIVTTAVIGLLAALGPAAIENTGAAPTTDVTASAFSTQLNFAGADASSLNVNIAPIEIAMAEPLLAAAVADLSIALNKPEPVSEAGTTPDLPAAEPAPVQIAMADPSDLDVGNPGDAARSVAAESSLEIADECLNVDVCVDRYLWALYQRTPKEDTTKERERRKVTVKRKGKMVTITKTFTKLVDQDFTWKDPKAAERAGMSMVDYVIGGMDRGFKLKLFQALHAAEADGHTPGITSAFRDDYRQSIASGLKAASNRSYHGGSLRGGYGHGMAVDIVGVEGTTRNQRWASSEKLWKWVDTRGKEFGIARPYLGRDPPHVGPVDGQEYASHSRGSKHASSDAKKARRVAAHEEASLAKRPQKRERAEPQRSLKLAAR